jgi:glutathione S-transferase
LDSIGTGARLFPAEGERRWSAMRQNSLGDAMLEAMISRRLESRRPEGERSQGWMDRQKSVVERCLNAMEIEVDRLSKEITIGHVAWVCALAHLDFRFGEESWRVARPALAAWYKKIEQRPSIRGTQPFD